ncbi:MAG: DUF5658 family protein [Haloarculaceae archaeon]
MQDSTPTGWESPVARARALWLTRAGDVSLEATLWFVVLASATLDVYTTYLGLSAGLTEGNPVVRTAVDGLGVGALAAVKLVVVTAAGLLRNARPRYSRVIALGLAVPWTATVLVNVAVLATL